MPSQTFLLCPGLWAWPVSSLWSESVEGRVRRVTVTLQSPHLRELRQPLETQGQRHGLSGLVGGPGDVACQHFTPRLGGSSASLHGVVGASWTPTADLGSWAACRASRARGAMSPVGYVSNDEMCL